MPREGQKGKLTRRLSVQEKISYLAENAILFLTLIGCVGYPILWTFLSSALRFDNDDMRSSKRHVTFFFFFFFR